MFVEIHICIYVYIHVYIYLYIYIHVGELTQAVPFGASQSYTYSWSPRQSRLTDSGAVEHLAEPRPAFGSFQMQRRYGCLYRLGVSFVGVLVVRDLLFGVYIAAFLETPT